MQAKSHRRRSERRLGEAEQIFFDNNLTYSIMVLANLIDRNTSRNTLIDLPIKLNEWRVLRMVKTFGPICAADIIMLIGLDKTTASRAVTRLQELGYVSLSPNPQDRRQTLITVTHAGRKLHDKTVKRDRRYDASFEQVLSAQELRQVHQIMKKLRRHAQSLLRET